MNEDIIKILQIEDNPGDARLIKEMLKECEELYYEYEHLEDLSEGVQRIKKGDIDIVLLDLGLSESSGLETLEILLSKALEIPAIIVMTGLNDEEYGLEAVKRGAQDYLIKGKIDGELICRSIRYALERYRANLALKKAHDGLENKVQERTLELTETVRSLETEINKRIKVEKELVRAKENAEESDRLKTHFLTNMSHEIRTPMNGIIGFVNLLHSGREINEEKRNEYISIVNKSSQRLLNTIDDILEISKIEAGKIHTEIVETDVSKSLKYLYELFVREANDKGIEIICSESEKSKNIRIQTDKFKLEGILTNLIKNALKFTEQGMVEFGTKLEGGNIVFFVKDTGLGIPEDKIEAIFDRFTQADLSNSRGYEGSGLGLSIAKAYAEKLGGKLQVQSKEGEGSAFYFSLPVN